MVKPIETVLKNLAQTGHSKAVVLPAWFLKKAGKSLGTVKVEIYEDKIVIKPYSWKQLKAAKKSK